MAKELNFSQLANVFVQAGKESEDKAKQALNVNAEDLLSQSIDLAPLDEGGLRESGSVEPATKKGNEVEARVGYEKEYALKMHEDVYTPSVSGTGRKYLENPTTQNSQKYADYFAEKMGDVWEWMTIYEYL